MEAYHIVLAPDLGLSPSDFVASWNADTETRQQAQASLTEASSKGYDPTLLVGILLTVAGGAAANLLSESILRMVDRKKKESHKHLHIEERQQPDGSCVLIVDIDE